MKKYLSNKLMIVMIVVLLVGIVSFSKAVYAAFVNEIFTPIELYSALNTLKIGGGLRIYTGVETAIFDESMKDTFNFGYYRQRAIYCIEHGQNLFSNVEMKYKLRQKIKIKGNKAYVNGISIIHHDVAKMAYILGQEGGYVKNESTEDTQKDAGNESVKAVWDIIESFGKNVINVKDYSIGIEGKHYNGDICDEAESYANTFSNNTSEIITNNTKVDKIKPKSIKIEKKEYIEVGPFNFKICGTLDSKEVVDADQKQIKGVKYYLKEDKNTNVFVTKMPIDKDFYIAVPTSNNYNLSKIKLKLKAKRGVYSGTIYVLDSEISNYQNLIVKKGEEDDENFSYETTWDDDEQEISLYGQIEVTKVDAKDKTPLKGVEFELYTKKATYIATYTTDKNGKFKTGYLQPGEYYFVEIGVGENNKYYEANSEHRNVKISCGMITEAKITNEKAKGDFKLLKVGKDSGKPLANVEFTLYMTEGKKKGQYVKQDGTYTTTKTTIKTNENGEIFIQHVYTGKYELRETSVGAANADYGYAIDESTVNVQIAGGECTEKIIENERKYIKVSGFVWEDIPEGKNTERNDIYSTDDKDRLYAGITVKLINENDSKQNQQTKTKEDGSYIFENVVIKDLENTYIEFEYNGLKYAGVKHHGNDELSNENYSRAADRDRKEFDDKFAEITSQDTDLRSKGEALDENNQKTFDLKYQRQGDKALFNFESETKKYNVNANTKVSKYSLKEKYDIYMGKNGKYEKIVALENVNLGIYEKEQADLTLLQDVEKIEIAFNNLTHTYEYGRKFLNGEDAFDMAVRFKNENTKEYTRPIYESDVRQDYDKDDPRNFKMYITYKIEAKNESSSIDTKVNSITNYYDQKYKINRIYKKVINDVEEKIDIPTAHSSVDKYNKIAIPVNEQIGTNQSVKLYIQYQIDKENVKELIKNENTELLESISEVKSFTNFYKGTSNYYSAIDKDSNPNNLKLELELVLGLLLGDCNADKNIDNKDLELLSGYLAGIIEYNSEGYLSHADINKDNKVDTQDINELDKLVNNYKDGPGDCNEDGKIDELDLGLLKRYLLDKRQTINLKKADVNGNGKVDVFDTLELNKVIDKYNKGIGDCNKDGKIDGLDLEWLNNYIIQTKENNINLSNADINQDGEIDIYDQQELNKMINIDGYKLNEDDADKAPGVQLVVNQTRTITGIIFEDKTVVINNSREGNGIFNEKDGDEKIEEGVKAMLVNTDNSVYKDTNGKEYSANVTEDGTYKIEDMPAGEYKIKFTWGDNYDVQQYKSTIYKEVGDNKYWYRNTESRLSDATDLYSIREIIDKEINNVEFKTFNMDSYTAEMKLEIENKENLVTDALDEILTEDGKVEYKIKNIDFGIAERPRQKLEIDKYVKHIKLTLQNGQTIVDSNLKNGELDPKPENVVYMAPKKDENILGKIDIILDNEIIQGSNLEITYGIKLKNSSEKDYINKAFYKFGKAGGNYSEPVKITSQKIVDIMDKDLVFSNEETINKEWEVVETKEIYKEYETKPVISEQEKYFEEKITMDDGTQITRKSFWESINKEEKEKTEWFEETLRKSRINNLNNGTMLKNEFINNELKAGEEKEVIIKSTKILSNQDELELDNKAEIIEVEKNGGSRIISTEEDVTDEAETVSVTPPTGENRNYYIYLVPIIIGLITITITLIIVNTKRIKKNK